jgi:arsenite methyltransferase
MDLLLVASAVVPGGRAVGIDMTDAMVAKAEATAGAAGLPNVELRNGDIQELPVESASADVVISNGVLNQANSKERASRILSPRSS